MKGKNKDLASVVIFAIGVIVLIGVLIWAGVSSTKETPDSDDSVSGNDAQLITFVDIDGNIHYEEYDPNDPNNIVDNFKYYEDGRVRNNYVSEKDTLEYELVDGTILEADNVSDDIIQYESDGETQLIPDAVPIYHIIDDTQMYHCNDNGLYIIADGIGATIKDNMALSELASAFKSRVNNSSVTAMWVIGNDGINSGLNVTCKEDEIVDYLPVFSDDPKWLRIDLYPSLCQYTKEIQDSIKSRYYQDIDDKFLFKENYYIDIDIMVDAFGQPYASEYHWSTGTTYLWRTDSGMYITFTEQPRSSGYFSTELSNYISIFSSDTESEYLNCSVIKIYEGTADFDYVVQ